MWGFESLWLPSSLLANHAQKQLADALFFASRFGDVELHFNRGLAGVPPEAVEAAKDTAMNPAVAEAFALAIIATGQGPAYPGIPDHEPDIAAGHKAAAAVNRAMNYLRVLASSGRVYVSESNFFERACVHEEGASGHRQQAGVRGGFQNSNRCLGSSADRSRGRSISAAVQTCGPQPLAIS